MQETSGNITFNTPLAQHISVQMMLKLDIASNQLIKLAFDSSAHEKPKGKQMKRNQKPVDLFQEATNWPNVATMAIALIVPAVLSSDGRESTGRLIEVLRWLCGTLIAAAILTLASRFPFNELAGLLTQP